MTATTFGTNCGSATSVATALGVATGLTTGFAIGFTLGRGAGAEVFTGRGTGVAVGRGRGVLVGVAVGVTVGVAVGTGVGVGVGSGVGFGFFLKIEPTVLITERGLIVIEVDVDPEVEVPGAVVAGLVAGLEVPGRVCPAAANGTSATAAIATDTAIDLNLLEIPTIPADLTRICPSTSLVRKGPSG